MAIFVLTSSVDLPSTNFEGLAYNCGGDERDLSECQETGAVCNPPNDTITIVCEVGIRKCMYKQEVISVHGRICK
jgi:hypothetical protein